MIVLAVQGESAVSSSAVFVPFSGRTLGEGLVCRI